MDERTRRTSSGIQSSPWHDLSPERRAPDEVTVVVETVTAQPPGVPLMRDRDKPDDKILAVPSHDPHQMEYFDAADIPQHVLREVEYFFATYKTLEGKKVEILGWEQSEHAAREISRPIDVYRTTYDDSTGRNRMLQTGGPDRSGRVPRGLM